MTLWQINIGQVVAKCELNGEMRDVSEGDMKSFGTFGSGEKTITILGGRWWQQRGEKDMDMMCKKICLVYGRNEGNQYVPRTRWYPITQKEPAVCPSQQSIVLEKRGPRHATVMWSLHCLCCQHSGLESPRGALCRSRSYRESFLTDAHAALLQWLISFVSSPSSSTRPRKHRN